MVAVERGGRGGERGGGEEEEEETAETPCLLLRLTRIVFALDTAICECTLHPNLNSELLLSSPPWALHFARSSLTSYFFQCRCTSTGAATTGCRRRARERTRINRPANRVREKTDRTLCGANETQRLRLLVCDFEGRFCSPTLRWVVKILSFAAMALKASSPHQCQYYPQR